MKHLLCYFTLLLSVVVIITASSPTTSATATATTTTTTTVDQQQFTLQSFATSLLSSPRDPNENDDDELGWTALHKAVFYSPSTAVEDVKTLIRQRGARVEVLTNGSSDSERTPLMLACQRGRLDIVKTLIEDFKAEPEMRDTRDRTALFFASLFGHDRIVKYLLEKTSANVHTADFKRVTPFLAACLSGSYKVVDVFIRHHHNDVVEAAEASASSSSSSSKNNLIDARDAFGRTCLHLAADRGGGSGGKVIAQDASTAPPEQPEQQQRIPSPLQKKHVDFVKVAQLVLKAKPDMIRTVDVRGENSLVVACAAGHAAMVQSLLRLGQEAPRSSYVADELNRDGESIVHVIAKEGHVDLAAQFFLGDDGNDDDDTNNIDDVAREKSSPSSSSPHVTFFTKSLDLPDNDGKTPLMHAAIRGHAMMVDFLFSRVVDGNSAGGGEKTPVDLLHQDRHGYNAFLYAVLHGHLAVAQKLHFFNPSLISTSKDQHGHNALHIAAWESKSLAVVKFLVHYQRSLASAGRNVDLLTPLHFAVQSRGDKAFEIVRYLVGEVDVDLADVMDASAKTALDVAVEQGKKEMEEFMRKTKALKQANKCGGGGGVRKKSQQESQKENPLLSIGDL